MAKPKALVDAEHVPGPAERELLEKIAGAERELPAARADLETRRREKHRALYDRAHGNASGEDVELAREAEVYAEEAVERLAAIISVARDELPAARARDAQREAAKPRAEAAARATQADFDEGSRMLREAFERIGAGMAKMAAARGDIELIDPRLGTFVDFWGIAVQSVPGFHERCRDAWVRALRWRAFDDSGKRFPQPEDFRPAADLGAIEPRFDEQFRAASAALLRACEPERADAPMEAA